MSIKRSELPGFKLPDLTSTAQHADPIETPSKTSVNGRHTDAPVPLKRSKGTKSSNAAQEGLFLPTGNAVSTQPSARPRVQKAWTKNDVTSPGKYEVRTDSLTMRDPARSRNIQVKAWYPEGKGPFPSIYYNHSASSQGDEMTYLATHLASLGFVVLAPFAKPGQGGDEMLGAAGDLSFLTTKMRQSNPLPVAVSKAKPGIMGLSSGAAVTAIAGLHGGERKNPDPRFGAIMLFGIPDAFIGDYKKFSQAGSKALFIDAGGDRAVPQVPSRQKRFSGLEDREFVAFELKGASHIGFMDGMPQVFGSMFEHPDKALCWLKDNMAFMLDAPSMDFVGQLGGSGRGVLEDKVDPEMCSVAIDSPGLDPSRQHELVKAVAGTYARSKLASSRVEREQATHALLKLLPKWFPEVGAPLTTWSDNVALDAGR